MRMLFLLCLVAAVFTGCLTERKAADRLAEINLKYPHLFERTTDTIVKEHTKLVMRDSLVWDTVFTMDGNYRELENEDMSMIIEINPDTFWKYRIRTVVKPDTLEVTCTDTLFLEKEKIVTSVLEKKVIPWWMIIVCLGLLIAALWALFTRNK